MSEIFKTRLPICEVCGKEPATSFSYFKRYDDWKFTGDCSIGTEDYFIEFDRFFRSPKETVDWFAHMSEKNWMNWSDFAVMMHRLRNNL